MIERPQRGEEKTPPSLKTPLPLEEAQTLIKADRGELTCPCCQQPLNGEVIDFRGERGVVLICTNWAECGFYEY